MPDSKPSPAQAAALPTSETIETLLNRVSVRKYTDKPVDEATVEAVLRAAFRAPTSSNIQAYSVVVVRDRKTLEELAPVTRDQKHVAEAPVFLAFCADLTRIARAMSDRGHEIDPNNMEMGLVSSIDAALVGMSASLAAESIGLKGVMIGAVRNDVTRVAEILGLPHHVYCVFGMVLGWPAEGPKQKPRMPFEGMVHVERYGNTPGAPDTGPATDTYDAQLAAHYESVGKATTPDSWSHDVDKKFAVRPREKLRAQLEERGFHFR